GGYICDTSHVVAFTNGLSYNVQKVGGMKSLFFSGEGLVCNFQGQGRLWMSTRNPSSLASFVYPYRPVQRSN
ncbi:MAG: AIM24 family protein, partial [Sandaracinaceae bacterium]